MSYRIAALSAALALGSALPPAAGAQASPPPAPQEIFTDEAARTGLDFVHFNGMSGELYFVEMNGAGAALFDYDRDGDLDAYLVQGAMLGEGKKPADATFPPREPTPRDRLFRNELIPSGKLRFTDVTARSGIDSRGYGMGVAVGDVDNDGWPDLYVTNFGANQLFRNRGDGSFADVTAAAGVVDDRWSVPALFADFDRDGWLDLYVGNYVSFSYLNHRTCLTPTGARDYCGPLAFQPETDRLLRNLGPDAGGKVRFEDVSARWGIRSQAGATLGAIAGDFNGDGRPDLYVANDQMANFLWIQQSSGGASGAAIAFRDEALLSGTAVNEEGRPEGSMGVDAGDFDGDGDEDLFMTHITRETNTLYSSDGGGFFVDATIAAELGPPSWEYTGFGAGFLDYDNDGWPDLLVVNGAVRILEHLALLKDPHPLHQRNQLYRNVPSPQGRRFEEVSGRAGAVFELSEVSRGAAFGDVDNDGDTDVLVTNNAGPARLLINRVGQDRRWLGLRLVGGGVERDMLGAWVGVHRPGATALWRRVRTGGSYASAGDPRVLVGLGDSPEVSRVEVRWPDGRRETWPTPEVGRYTTLRQGEGTAAAEGPG